MSPKFHFEGEVRSVQPRIRMTRSFDQRQHSYLGFAVGLEGYVAGDAGDFIIGIGKAAQAKHQLQAGDVVGGQCLPVEDPRLDPVDYYKVGGLKVLERAVPAALKVPPWLGAPPTLEGYRERGHRRLAAVTYKGCAGCIYGCRMAVEMIIDHWNPARRQYRFETFCYGPKSCTFYKPGPPRVVPGRKGMKWVEEDWVDEEETAHRGPND